MKTLEEIKSHWRINVLEETPDGMKGTISFAQWTGSFIFSFDAGWEHLSIRPFNKRFTPSWDEMSTAKNIFWHEEEAAIQIHPPKSEYVNNLSNCLHLWRCTYREMVLPPSCLVGVKEGQTRDELRAEIENAYRIAGEEPPI